MPQGVPLATYRIQFNGGFRFADAEAIVPYLCRLGATHLYASPIFEARPGSTHGYDVTNHGALNPELGTEVDFTSLVQRLRSEGMSLLLDIVPNHMAADISNPWWADVLRHGQESRYASFFDIDWEGGEGRLVLPMLGHSVAEAVDEGHLGIVEEQGEYALAYFDKRWPVSPSTRGLAADAAKGDKQALLSLLDAQTYRLVHWRAEPPNYRRFFDIGDLVSV
ncbi:MAG: alpha-amylase family glycosyl hydrolase, partial [Dehalococcoidia bacterium]